MINYMDRMECFIVRGEGTNIVLERFDYDMRPLSARPATAEELMMYNDVEQLKSGNAKMMETMSLIREEIKTAIRLQESSMEEGAKSRAYLARANALLGQAGRLIVDLGKEVMEYKEEESKHDEKVDAWSEKVIQLNKELHGLSVDDVPGAGG